MAARWMLIGMCSVGCMVPPTTMGLRSSAELLREGAPAEAGVHAGMGGQYNTAPEEHVGALPMGGDIAVHIPGTSLDLAGSGSWAPVLVQDIEGAPSQTLLPLSSGQAEVRFGTDTTRRADQMMWMAGVGATRVRIATDGVVTPDATMYIGPYIGWMLGTQTRWGPHLYGGYKVNPVFNDGYRALWSTGTVGLRASADRRVRLGAELTGAVGTEGFGGFGHVYATSRLGGR